MTTKQKKFLSILLSTFCVLHFQNCSGGVKGVPNGPYSFTALEDNELFTIRSGLQFKNEFKTDPFDLSGLSVCDYPDITNCLNNGQGELRGQTRFWETGLSPTSSVHRLNFTLRSNGYFQRNQNSNSQILIGLRGRVAFNSEREPIGLNGRGLSLGSRNSTNPTCLNQSAALQGFYDDAHSANNLLPSTQLFSSSCSDSLLQDGQDYHVELYASNNQKVGIKIFNQQLQLIHSSLLPDTNNSLNPNLTGAFFSHRNPNSISNTNEDWSFTISNIQVSQTSDTIESYFSEPPLSFNLGTSTLPNLAQISTLDLSNIGLSVGNFYSYRTRAYYCLGLQTDIILGNACQNSSAFSEVLFASNPHFIFNSDRLNLNGNSLFQSLPQGQYQLIFRLNPEAIESQTEVLINKPI